MTGGYVLCEYEQVKKNFPEFARTMASLKTALVAKATADWSPKSFGGLAPRSDQFGETTILPALFRGLGQVFAAAPVAGTNSLQTWHQFYNAVGSQMILQGVNQAGTIPEDYKIGLAGIAFLSKAIRISEIKMQISDKKLPRINIEEALAYNKPAIIFEDGYILDEETGFDLHAFITTRGPQRILPIGLQLNRVPNRLQVTNTGAVVT